MLIHHFLHVCYEYFEEVTIQNIPSIVDCTTSEKSSNRLRSTFGGCPITDLSARPSVIS